MQETNSTEQPIPQKKSKLFWLILFILIFGGYFFWNNKSEKITIENKPQETKPDEERIMEEKVPEEESVKHTVSQGDIPAEVFKEYGKLDANDVEALLLASKDVYDFSKIKIGQDLFFYFQNQSKAQKIKYILDTENFIVVQKSGESFEVKKEKIPYSTKEETLKVVIDEFLYKDALDAGLGESSVLEIADVFSFDVDFMTDIQAGDELTIVYEKRTLNGESAPDGKIIASKFINTGKEYFAYYFNGAHYDSDGHELVKQFLRAPLSYRQITSGYTGARRHPITKKVTAHYQIDYAAPVGTPVVATAKGTVSSAGYSGGWGNIVRLNHDNGFTTHYGHLSAFGKNIKAGVSVLQGQVVGYVGSTGWSTGPHLDYGMRLNGAPVNPLSLQLPKGNPLSGEEMEKFQEQKKKYDELLRK